MRRVIMSKTYSFKLPQNNPRTPLAMVARSRKAGAMHDRRAPRGGARNEMRDIMDELDDEEMVG